MLIERIVPQPVTAHMRLVQREGVLVAEADPALPVLMAEQVRDALEQVRR